MCWCAATATSVTVAEGDKLLSPQEVAARLGLSRQHVRRLVDAGELEGRQMPNSRYWKIPLSSVLAFEQRRERGRELTDVWSAELDALGAQPNDGGGDAEGRP